MKRRTYAVLQKEVDNTIDFTCEKRENFKKNMEKVYLYWNQNVGFLEQIMRKVGVENLTLIRH